MNEEEINFVSIGLINNQGRLTLCDSYFRIKTGSDYLYYWCGKVNIKKKLTRKIVVGFFEHRKIYKSLYPSPLSRSSDLELVNLSLLSKVSDHFRLILIRSYKIV